MIKAVIFDMYETLITHYGSPVYFGEEMARDAGIPKEKFYVHWRNASYDHQRTIGKMTFEKLLEFILRENHCYSETLLELLVKKRISAKKECFEHLHNEIIPLLTSLREKGVFIGVISNCYLEEAEVIRKSILFPYFDKVFLSCEQGTAKPDKEIFLRCMKAFEVSPEDCLYVGDGGSCELETARDLGMNAVQAVWYLKDEIKNQSKRMNNFSQAERPFDLFNMLSLYTQEK